MNDNYDHVINGWQALVIMGPSIIAAIISCINAYFNTKSRNDIAKNTQITAETKEKVENVNINQKNMNDLINSRQTELIDIVKKSSYAEGIIEGLKRDQTFTANHIFDDLKRKQIIKNDQEEQAKIIIKSAVDAKDQLIKEALLNKAQMEADIIAIKEKLIRDLNEKLISEK